MIRIGGYQSRVFDPGRPLLKAKTATVENGESRFYQLFEKKRH